MPGGGQPKQTLQGQSTYGTGTNPSLGPNPQLSAGGPGPDGQWLDFGMKPGQQNQPRTPGMGSIPPYVGIDPREMKQPGQPGGFDPIPAHGSGPIKPYPNLPPGVNQPWGGVAPRIPGDTGGQQPWNGLYDGGGGNAYQPRPNSLQGLPHSMMNMFSQPAIMAAIQQMLRLSRRGQFSRMPGLQPTNQTNMGAQGSPQNSYGY